MSTAFPRPVSESTSRLAAGVVFLSMWLVAMLAVARDLSTERFANVFVETQSVQIAISPGDAMPVQLRDLNGVEVARRNAAGEAGVVEFGVLPPGYYEAVAGDVVLPLVVLIDPDKRVRGESRLAVDNAMSWLVTADQWDHVAELLRLCGISCVRERLGWGEVERERGQLNWGRYDRTATILHERGIDVYQIFHSVPTWCRVDKDPRAVPEDLRDVYRFAQALATQFRGRVQAWEAWNEPDISFFSHPSCECAAYQKAAFLGFRSVDPAQRVLGPSMAYGAGAFSEGLLDNGAGKYLDIWNYHIYADPAAYAGRREGFLAQLARYDVVVPDWITEAGDPQQGPEGVLAPSARLHQAQFLSRAFPQSLAAGVDRHFWFVFPFFHEGNGGWGLFEPRQRAPFAGVAALATVTYALGRGDCLGTLSLADKDSRAIAFARGDDTAAVAVWRESDEPAELTLPLNWEEVREARTYLGTPLAEGCGTPLTAGHGPVQLRAARAAVYFVVPPSALQGKLTPPARSPIVPRDDKEQRSDESTALREIVVRLRALQATPDKAIDAYRVAAGAAAELQVEVYNFGPETFQGDASLTAPDGWKIEPDHAAVSVVPGERTVVPVRLAVPQQKEPASIRLVARSAAGLSTPAVVRLCAELSSLTPSRSLPLNLDDPAQWQKNIAGHGTAEISAGGEGGVRLSFTFSTNGDNWAYPRVAFAPQQDWSAYDGLRFEYRTDTADPGAIRVFLFEPAGAGYISDTGMPGSTTWRIATVLFSQLGYVSATPPDPNGKLDTNRVAGLSIGAHCKPLSLVLDVRNIQVVKF